MKHDTGSMPLSVDPADVQKVRRPLLQDDDSDDPALAAGQPTVLDVLIATASDKEVAAVDNFPQATSTTDAVASSTGKFR